MMRQGCFAMLLAGCSLAGCAAAVTTLEYKDLEVQIKMTRVAGKAPSDGHHTV
jgi:hypothetical protein